MPGTIPYAAQGFQLLAKAVSRYTGIARFDAGAVHHVHRLRDMVNALGGIDVYVDQQTVSIHNRPTEGRPVPQLPHGVTGPRDLPRRHDCT